MKQLTGNEVEIVRKETCNLPTQNEETFWLEEAYKTDFNLSLDSMLQTHPI